MKTVNVCLAVLCLTALGLSQIDAAPTTFNFEVISPFNRLINKNIGEANLFMDVDSAGSGMVSFKFYNTDTSGSSAKSIYFDDDVNETGAKLLSSYSIGATSTGVSFITKDGAPPGGENLTPDWHKNQSDYALTKSGGESDGLDNPSEFLTVLAMGDLDDVIAGLNSNYLRIGLHVGSFPEISPFDNDDGSDSDAFVHKTNVIVPAPSALLLGGIGLSLCAWRRKKTRTENRMG